MNLQLINQPTQGWTPTQQILFNRGIQPANFHHYLNASDADINEPDLLGIDVLKQGVQTLIAAIQNQQSIVVVVDCDCDGYTSAALIINYLFKLFPTWAACHLFWTLHQDKTHGLVDKMPELLAQQYAVVICPDGASEDFECHRQLKEHGSTVLVLDHHLANKISSDAIIINNQLSAYPNKDLAGVGVTWQFCRFFDRLLGQNTANDFLDLVALGLTSDMMSLHSIETQYLIKKGFLKTSIKNPFIEYILDKNHFSLSKSDYKSAYEEEACTSIGAAFFIAPFVNAITRSGTLEEKNLFFQSMLDSRAFIKIPEIKRNKVTGKHEQLILQALRVATNVKNRQTRDEESCLVKLEMQIKTQGLLDKRFLLFLLEDNSINSAIRGLVANKMMAKYQRPCAILTKTDHGTYEGSMRGYTKTGLLDFKQLLETCPGVLYVRGHSNAAGLGIDATQIDQFISDIEEKMSTLSTKPLYRIDYLFNEHDNDLAKTVLDIADMNDLWGQDLDRAYIGIRFKVTPSNFSIMKSNTLKINLSNSLSLIKFKGTEEDIAAFTTTGWKEIEAYCKCNCNEWNGHKSAQLIIEDYEIIDSCKYFL